MAEKKKDSEFKVSDRRLFTADGELRSSAEEETPPVEQKSAVATAAPEAAKIEEPPAAEAQADMNVPPPPSASEQQAQHDAYASRRAIWTRALNWADTRPRNSK